MFKKMSKKPIILTFLNTFPNLHLSPLLNFGMNPKFDHIPPMYILLKLHYAKFDISGLLCSKVIEKTPLGGRLDPPPLGKGRIKVESILYPAQPMGKYLVIYSFIAK